MCSKLQCLRSPRCIVLRHFRRALKELYATGTAKQRISSLVKCTTVKTTLCSHCCLRGNKSPAVCQSNLSKAAPSPPRRYTGSWLFHWNHLPCALYSVHCALYIRIVERERWVFFWRKCPGRALTLLTSWKILVSPVQQIQALIINFCQHWITISISFAQSSTFW